MKTKGWGIFQDENHPDYAIEYVWIEIIDLMGVLREKYFLKNTFTFIVDNYFEKHLRISWKVIKNSFSISFANGGKFAKFFQLNFTR